MPKDKWESKYNEVSCKINDHVEILIQRINELTKYQIKDDQELYKLWEQKNHIEQEIKKIADTMLSQGAFAIDGIFYKIGENGKYTQADITLLNPVTGKEINSNQNLPLENQNINEKQHQEIDEYRLIMTIDYRYVTEIKLINHQSVFEYQKDLREKLSKDNICVRPAKNLLNETGVGIVFGQVLGKEISVYLRHKIKSSSITRDVYYNSEILQKEYVFIASVQSKELLHQELTQFIGYKKNQPKFISLLVNIAMLSSPWKKDKLTNCFVKKTNATELINSFLNLEEYLKNLDAHSWKVYHTTIVDHFLKLTNRLIENENPLTEQEVTTSREDLNGKLTQYKPMSKKGKTIICAIFAALIGMILGAVVGSGISCGLANISTSMADASKDFFLGTGIGGGVGLLTGALLGGAIGFFSGNKHNHTYNAECKSSEEKTNEVFTQLKPIEKK